MSLKFTKQNLVYILMIVNEERGNGIFLNDLIEYITRCASAKSKSGTKSVGNVSRATLFNYFKDLNQWLEGRDGNVPRYEMSFEFIKNNQRTADKFYKKFNKYIFSFIVKFLEDNQYIGYETMASNVSSIKNSLYFSLVEFLGVHEHAVREKHEDLSGDYKVYRPSLSAPGKILVSCARIETQKDGSLKYLELMHFKNSLGWRRQILEGYVVSREGRISIITKDTNTKFIQFSALYSILRGKWGRKERTVVTMMAGSYTGTTDSQRSGLFSTGMFLARENFRNLNRYDVTAWKIGLVGGYGIVDVNQIPRDVMKYMANHDFQEKQ